MERASSRAEIFHVILGSRLFKSREGQSTSCSRPLRTWVTFISLVFDVMSIYVYLSYSSSLKIRFLERSIVIWNPPDKSSLHLSGESADRRSCSFGSDRNHRWRAITDRLAQIVTQMITAIFTSI